MKALSIRDVAAEFGKSESWLYENWRDLVAIKRLPPPLTDGMSQASAPTWSAAQVYAVLDRPLTRDQRIAAAAFRAAIDAIRTLPALDDLDEVAASRARLDQRRVTRQSSN